MSETHPPQPRWWAGDRGLGCGVLALTVLVYAWSLSGDWVWDDVFQYRDNPAITKPLVLVANDIWGPTGRAALNAMPVYRPLAMLSHVPGQILWPGPAVERVLNLALHLAIVAGVAWLVATLGASRRAAWFGAACLAWHPAVTESVAWISSRGDVMGSGLVLIGMIALHRDRPAWSGVCFALAPFCKETFVLAPVALAIWMIALRKKSMLAPAMAVAGVAAYLGVRSALGIQVPSDVGGKDAWGLIGAIGSVSVRGLELLLVPTAPDVRPSFVLHPIAGIVAAVVGLASFAALPGRPALGLLLAPLPFIALAAPASLANGLVADRYYYVAAIGFAAAAGLGFDALQTRGRWAPLLFGIPLLMAPFASARAADWVSNRDLFRASLARHPDDPEALFQVAYDLHVAQGDCEAAVPLYRRAMAGSPRAGNNLQACLYKLGRFEDAASLGPELARQDPVSATPALNTARALARLGRPDDALRWAMEALRREPEAKRCHVLLGQVLGEQGRYRDALRSFERALELAPDDPDAIRGFQLVSHKLATTAAPDRGAAP
jgi:hypothetical protein